MAEKKLKRKLRGLFWCLFAVAIVIAIRVAYEQIDSRRIINDGCLERNLTSIAHTFPKAPDLEERGMPWGSEIPALIAKDIEYLKTEPDVRWIEYQFYNWHFFIHINEKGEPYLGMDGYQHPYLFDFYDFSFYSDGVDKLVLYGYDLNSFESYTFMKDDYDFTYHTYNKTLPFTEKDSFAYTRGEYTVCFPEDRDVVYAYRDGKIVTKEYAIPENCRKWWNGLIVSEDGNLEMLYVVENGENVELRFEPVGEIKYADRNYSTMKVEDTGDLYIELPMFNEDGDRKILTPKDWDTYLASRAGKTIKNPNYEMEFISLDEDSFKRVEFSYNSSGVSGGGWWSADIIFDVSGKEIRYVYTVNGYDRHINLPEQFPKEKTVYSVGEFWDFITTIRETYKLYYDYPDGE